jgi:hypothetical protein
MLNKTVASDHKRSDNTYISSRISSLDTEDTMGISLVTLPKNSIPLLPGYIVFSVLLRASKINNIRRVEIEWTQTYGI